ncbi:hypothetical protein Tco_1039549, partial [Tanacetum coccineum]
SSIKSDESAGTPSPFTIDQINKIMALIGSKPDSDKLWSCVVDSLQRSLIGTSSEKNGLYFFDLGYLVQFSKSPYEMIQKIKPCLSHFKSFGCLCFATVLNNNDKFAARDVKFYETVFPFKNETVRKDLVFEENGVNNLNFFEELYDQESNKSNEPYDDKSDIRKGDRDGILKTHDYADVSTNTSPTATSQTEEVVNQSPTRHDNNSLDDLGSSCTSPKGVDTTLYDDYEYGGEGFVDFNQLFDSDHINNLESSVLRRSSRHYKMLPKFDNYVFDKRVKYDINSVVNYFYLSIDNFVFSNNLNKSLLVQH